MTTPQTSPYDKDIEAYNASSHGMPWAKSADGKRILVRDHLANHRRREGYLRAKAEDADLLAAARAAIAHCAACQVDGACYEDAHNKLRAAIQKAVGQ